MKAEDGEERDVGALLKRVLADDLPAGVAAGMRERAERVRRGEEAALRAWGLRLPRGAWAALSILMLVLGSLLQGLGAPSPLASRISLLGTRAALATRLDAATSMSCSASVRAGRGVLSGLRIEWESKTSAALVAGPDGEHLGTIGPGEPGAGDDPRLRTAAQFSSPSALRALLAGDWRRADSAAEGGRETGRFTIDPGAGTGILEIVIDPEALLPLRLERRAGQGPGSRTGAVLWRAEFIFQEGEERR